MIELTTEQIAKAEHFLGHIPGATQKALSRAVNRSVEAAKTVASSQVRKSYYIKQKDVNNTITLNRARPSDITGSIVSRGTPLALSKYRVTPKKPQPGRKRSILARVKRGEGGPIRKAFVAQMRSGHIGVFRRLGKKRFPIDQLYGPSVPQMLGNVNVSEAIEKRAEEVLDERLEHEIKWILEGNE